MKILSPEEKQAHTSHILAEGFKGLMYGGAFSIGLFQYIKRRHPVRFKSFNPSIKAAIIAMPTISIAAFFADQGSVEFDRNMHQSEYQEAKILEEYRNWNKLSLSDKCFTVLNDNKYPIIVSAWAASLYGSWVFVNRDKIMDTAQKAVQARMYAQGITIVLLLGTILLAIKEEEIKKKQPKPIPEWKKIIMEKEAEDERLLQEARAAKEKIQAQS